LAFGICWAAIFLFTNVGMALGDPVDPNAINPLSVLFWIELGVSRRNRYVRPRGDERPRRLARARKPERPLSTQSRHWQTRVLPVAM
jgi:hypothetical protein